MMNENNSQITAFFNNKIIDGNNLLYNFNFININISIYLSNKIKIYTK